MSSSATMAVARPDLLSLALFVLGVLTDDPHHAATSDDAALVTHFLD
jgi:hypothetical protein